MRTDIPLSCFVFWADSSKAVACLSIWFRVSALAWCSLSNSLLLLHNLKQMYQVRCVEFSASPELLEQEVFLGSLVSAKIYFRCANKHQRQEQRSHIHGGRFGILSQRFRTLAHYYIWLLSSKEYNGLLSSVPDGFLKIPFQACWFQNSLKCLPVFNPLWDLLHKAFWADRHLMLFQRKGCFLWLLYPGSKAILYKF